MKVFIRARLNSILRHLYSCTTLKTTYIKTNNVSQVLWIYVNVVMLSPGWFHLQACLLVCNVMIRTYFFRRNLKTHKTKVFSNFFQNSFPATYRLDMEICRNQYLHHLNALWYTHFDKILFLNS